MSLQLPPLFSSPVPVPAIFPALPALPVLLTQGGGQRIVPDAGSGRSAYGCFAEPSPVTLELGSSTASTISPAGFAAAAACRERLQAALAAGQPPEVLYAQEMSVVRQQLQTLWQLPAGTRCVLAASGTDAHLIAAHLIAADCRITVAGAETGSGVPAALSGCHPYALTPAGQSVPAGAPVDPVAEPSRLLMLPARDAGGAALSPGTIANAWRQAVEQAVKRGERVLLVLTDVSKTGLIVPDAATVHALHRRWPDRVAVLVDACQGRLAPATLHDWLAAGWAVALTGSKFFGGPTFCAALLLPAARSLWPVQTDGAARLAALAPYCCRAEWPADDTAAWHGLPARSNFGLLLRWTAALQEMAAFLALPDVVVEAFVRRFAAALFAQFARHACFRGLPTPAIERFQPAGAVRQGWDQWPTIFPFLLYAPDGEGKLWPLPRTRTRALYEHFLHHCQPDGRFIRFGQPVDCGSQEDVPASALRLCLSAPMIVRACQTGEAGAVAVIAEALEALDRLAAIVQGETKPALPQSDE